MSLHEKTDSDSWSEFEIPPKTIENWNQIVNLLAKVFNVPSALIMRVHPQTIEVFITSKTKGNPFEKGEESDLHGHYCTEVVRSQKTLLVPNALKDPAWSQNLDTEIGMVSYLGMPLNWSNGEIFGTICVQDVKENHYSELLMELLGQFKEMVENQLSLIMQNEELSKARKKIDDYQQILPKCSYCKSVRLVDDTWVSIDDYLKKNRSTDVSHGICPDCWKIHFPDYIE